MTSGCEKVVLSYLMAMISLMFVSCSSKSGGNLSVFTVERTTFDDVLKVEGFTESLSAVSLVCPQDADGSIEYLIENGTMVKKGDTLCIIDDPRIEEQYENWLLFLENVFQYMDKYRYEPGMQTVVDELATMLSDTSVGTSADRACLLDCRAALEKNTEKKTN
jgi:hypothetical protein